MARPKNKRVTKKVETKKTITETPITEIPTSTKEQELTVKSVIEVNGIQTDISDIKERVLEAYETQGHSISSVEELQIYMNMNEGRAYYVINGKSDGSYIDL